MQVNAETKLVVGKRAILTSVMLKLIHQSRTICQCVSIGPSRWGSSADPQIKLNSTESSDTIDPQNWTLIIRFFFFQGLSFEHSGNITEEIPKNLIPIRFWFAREWQNLPVTCFRHQETQLINRTLGKYIFSFVVGAPRGVRHVPEWTQWRHFVCLKFPSGRSLIAQNWFKWGHETSDLQARRSPITMASAAENVKVKALESYFSIAPLEGPKGRHIISIE